jgi:hypothetical protein
MARWVVVAWLSMCGVAIAEPVHVCSANPHYLMVKDRPIVLITSDHHYGAVIDLDFDPVAYLGYLHRSGMNLTRIYPGGMFEPPDKYLPGNPLGPKPGRQILPWARSNQTGAHPSLAEPGKPAFKYDLDRWDPNYFDRLRTFVDSAESMDIVVEVAFFNCMYKDCWPLMPLYHGNNIQGVGNYEADDCRLFTTTDKRNADVLERQKAYVRKIVTELARFDNVIYDICDEPTLEGASEAQVIPWIHELRDALLETERPLGVRHILGQTVQSSSPDLSKEPWCDWLPTEYVKAAANAFDKDYAANKPIVDVESDYYGYGLVKPYTVDDVRVEGWWFMVGGGAGFINLNGEYYRGHETGGPDTQNCIVPQKKVLRDFMEGLNLVSLQRFTGVTSLPAGVIASAIADPGRQYAVYLFHGTYDSQWGAHFVATPGSFDDRFTLTGVPRGDYTLEWIDPATGAVKRTETKSHNAGDLAITTGPYTTDIALRMKRSLRDR